MDSIYNYAIGSYFIRLSKSELARRKIAFTPASSLPVFFIGMLLIGLDGILIVYGIAVIHQEPVCAGVILEAVQLRFTFAKLAKEPQAEFPVFILSEFFYIIASHIYTGIIGFIIEVIIAHSRRSSNENQL